MPLSSNYKHLVTLCKRDLVSVYISAIEAVKPDKLIKDSLCVEGERLTFKDPLSHVESVSFNLNETNLHVIGGGKCVLAMARGLSEIFSRANMTNKFSHGGLSLPAGLRTIFENDTKTQSLLKSINVNCLFGSYNNLPDENSLTASNYILNQVVEACQKDKTDKRRPLFIILISGGGSACLTSPRYINISQKLEIIKQLVQKGADIVELNKVRRYFSNIKGGQLARFILRQNPDSQVLSLILSDVIGDPVEFIASGPTYLPDADHIHGHHHFMSSVLTKYGLEHLVCALNKVDTQNEQIDCLKDTVINKVIGNNRIALDAAIDRAQALGYKTECLGNAMHGFTQDVVKDIIEFGDKTFRDHDQNKMLIVCGGETTVEKLEDEKWGKGGRAQEMALDYIISRLSPLTPIEGSKVVDFFLAGGTDGQDGPTDVAACLASLAELSIDGDNRRTILADARQAKHIHDSNSFWNSLRPDWLIKTGLTETNVMDLYFYLKAR